MTDRTEYPTLASEAEQWTNPSMLTKEEMRSRLGRLAHQARQDCKAAGQKCELRWMMGEEWYRAAVMSLDPTRGDIDLLNPSGVHIFGIWVVPVRSELAPPALTPPYIEHVLLGHR